MAVSRREAPLLLLLLVPLVVRRRHLVVGGAAVAVGRRVPRGGGGGHGRAAAQVLGLGLGRMLLAVLPATLGLGFEAQPVSVVGTRGVRHVLPGPTNLAKLGGIFLSLLERFKHCLLLRDRGGM
jgi:hypothetical protein